MLLRNVDIDGDFAALRVIVARGHRVAIRVAARSHARFASTPTYIPLVLTSYATRGLSATGGSAIKAVEVLKDHKVPEERIIFLNLVSATSSTRCHASKRVISVPAEANVGLCGADTRYRRRKGSERSAPSSPS